MNKTFKYILFFIGFLILIIAAILVYQTYGVSENTNWENKDDIEQSQENSTDSIVNSNSIFD